MGEASMLRDVDDTAAPAKLIVGLGNPGERHAKNRHNVGFQLLDRIAHKYRLSFDRQEAQALLAHGQVAGQRVILLKPLTYMNQSGKAVKRAVQRYRISLTDMLVVYDDLDLPLGKARLRERGGAAGHKGMKSIIASLGTQDIVRLRIGIGRPNGEAPEEYVLHDFSAQESAIMEEGYDKAIAALEYFLREDIAAAMNRYN